jgi:hypothetical protein
MDEKAITAEPGKKQRRRFQFRLRSLLIFGTLVGCGLGWLAVKVQQARKQQAAVKVIEKMGGHAEYDYEFDGSGEFIANARPPGPSWIRALVGDNLFRDIVYVRFAEDDFGLTRMTDPGLKEIACLRAVKTLYLSHSADVSDTGIAYVAKLTNLETLDLSGTGISDAGIAKLAALTHLKDLDIHWTNVSDAGLRHLCGMRTLRHVRAFSTKATSAGVGELRAALPEATIEWDPDLVR